LFHEDAQGAQAIHLSTLPLVDRRVESPERESSLDEAVVGLVDGHLFTILRGSLRDHLTMMPRIAGRNATAVVSMRLVWHNNLVLWPQ
jgi:hypothetical protein